MEDDHELQSGTPLPSVLWDPPPGLIPGACARPLSCVSLLQPTLTSEHPGLAVGSSHVTWEPLPLP